MVRSIIHVLLAVCTTAVALDANHNDGRAFLSLNLHPETVAKTLSHVEDEWQAQARAFIRCELTASQEVIIRDCDDTPSAFSKSCATVVSAVVQGSSGVPNVMKEYMGDICGQATMASWHQVSCNVLSNRIFSRMSASSYENRVRFPTGAVCDDFWTSFLAEQKTVHHAELADIKEEEQKDIEAVAAKAHVAKEKKEKSQKDLDEAEKGDDAKEEADIEAERKIVALHATRTADDNLELKQKKAEVEAIEKKAKAKIDEATKVEQEK